MDLLFGITIFIVSHIWILIELQKWRPYEYDTLFCRDVRASMGMIAYASELEEKRKHINSRKSKF